MDFALGPLGLLPWNGGSGFWELTWDEYYRIVEGYHIKNDQLWEHTRFVSTVVYNANSKKPKSPEQLVPLRIDELRRKNAPKIDIARLQEVMRARQAELNRRNGKQ